MTLSAAGLMKLGLSYPTWRLPVTRLAHVHQVNVVRLWQEASESAASQTWICERDLLVERGRLGQWHIGDAAVTQSDVAGPVSNEPHWLVEVELTPKTRSRYVSEVFESLHPSVRGLAYFCPPKLLERIQRDVTTAQGQARRGRDVRLTFRELPSLEDVDAACRDGE
ncbi:MAG: hypothetical protein WA966_10560 [Ornithinimicrobium sp.]